MPDSRLIPAAQYLRMSTDQQQYSLVNQAAAIARYAERRQFEVVKTYEDAARSGLVLKERPGLRKLLSDVVAPNVPYRAILVYDVSRWGRFQDSDESAAYEFICKSSGVPVHYCAEQFPNDSSISSSIMKALKRAMAAEFSRELGVKSYEGQRRLALLGFKMGGRAGYGLRRMMLSPDGRKKKLLQRGEYKAISTNRIILVPGPEAEIATVRRIYSMALKGMWCTEIARELNRLEVKYVDGRRWKYWIVSAILRHEKYAGWNVWGQTSRKMHGPTVALPRKDWIARAEAFQPIIDQETFDAVQKIRSNRTKNKSNAALLAALKRLLNDRGYLYEALIDRSRRVPSLNTYYRRFGSLGKVYELVGYSQRKEYFLRRRRAQRTEQLHVNLVQRIAGLFPESISLAHNPPKRRRLLLVDGHILVSVYLCRSIKWPNGRPCWKLDPVKGEKHNITLLCALNSDNDEVQSMYLFPSLGRTGTYKFGAAGKWLDTAKRLRSLTELHDAVLAAEVEVASGAQSFRPYRMSGAARARIAASRKAWWAKQRIAISPIKPNSERAAAPSEATGRRRSRKAETH